MTGSSMTPDRWQRAQELFVAALELETDPRTAFLDRECKGDSELREEVESLLRSHQRPGRADALLDRLTTSLSRRVSLKSGEHIGPYRIVREIGQGGMGAVYLGERDNADFTQRVAIKLIRFGQDAERLQRLFLNERQILATLEHPNIARLVDGGMTESGLPFFAMEYVDGPPITTYADEERLDINRRLDLFVAICGAIQYAHQNLVVHRDLKPSNILVAQSGVAKLLDFGVAKLLTEGEERDVRITQTGARWITPGYASPEQVRGDAITTATDIYALGVLLYELLTGRRPYRFPSKRAADIERTICEADPERPSAAITRTTDTEGASPDQISRLRNTEPDKLRRRLSGDLDTIVLKALHKDPGRRYASAAAFAEDIERHREGLPVLARPDTLAYRTSKFIRRHTLGVAAASLVGLSVIAGGVATAWQAQRATRQANLAAVERDNAQRQATKAERVSSLMMDVFRQSDQSDAGSSEATVREVLDQGADRIYREFEGQPEVQATMLHELAQVYGNIGLYPEAQELIENAIQIRRRLFGDAHPDLASSLDELGNIHRQRGELDSAEARYRNALSMRRGIFPADHQELGASLGNLGDLVRERGRMEEAEPLLREALTILRARLGPSHPEVAHATFSLAATLHGRNDFRTSEQLFREAVDIYRKFPDQLHPEAATSLENLSTVLQFRGRYDEAEPMLREALNIREKLYAPDHPEVIRTRWFLAILLQDMSRFKESLAVFHETNDVGERVFGQRHPRVIQAKQAFGWTLHKVGRDREAVELLQFAFDGYREHYGPDHGFRAFTLVLLGDSQRDLADYEGAEASYDQSLAISGRLYGENHPYIVIAQRGKAVSALERGRVEQADSLFALSLAMGESLLRENHPYITDTKLQYARVLRAKGQLASADSLYREIADIRRTNLPEGHAAIATPLWRRGEIMMEQRLAESAEPLLREALEIRANAFPEHSWKIAEIESALGACLTALDRFEEAEPLLLESYAIISEQRGKDHPLTHTAARRLTTLYESTDQPDLADRFREIGPDD